MVKRQFPKPFSTRWPRPHFGHSMPLAPSDHFRTETAFVLVCDGDLVGLVLGGHVQMLFSPARTCVLPPHVARRQHRSHSLRALRVEIFAVVRPLLALFFLSWVLGSQPWLFFFMGPWVPLPGCFSFFTSIWHVFHHRKMSLSLRSLLSELW